MNTDNSCTGWYNMDTRKSSESIFVELVALLALPK